ncbi:hypothetical protein V866_005274 [Kwoniella sp. B9012]|uniref:Uncharacterized protein n=1 Tax=Kwoniella europaea PYCC6329 TaxID=1423913 RepID=A0AAX4KNQ0_9TREE
MEEDLIALFQDLGRLGRGGDREEEEPYLDRDYNASTGSTMPYRTLYDTKVNSTALPNEPRALSNLDILQVVLNHEVGLYQPASVGRTRKAFERYLETSTDLGTLYLLKNRDSLLPAGSGSAGTGPGIDNLKERIDMELHRCAHYASDLIRGSASPTPSSSLFQPTCKREQRNSIVCPSANPNNRSATTGILSEDLFNSTWDYVRERMKYGLHTTAEEKSEMTSLASDQTFFFEGVN